LLDFVNLGGRLSAVARPFKAALFVAIFVAAIFVLVMFFKQGPIATDVAQGYSVLHVTLTSGKDNAFEHRSPNGALQTVFFDTSIPTNVLWVLFAGPRTDSDRTIRWIYTTSTGQAVTGRMSRTVWGKGYAQGPENIVWAFPAPIPAPEGISNEIVTFQLEETGKQLFKIRVP
jgi:hypothetical protein